MPEVTTMPERASGVSAAKVVATMDVPKSHHVVPPPDLKYCSEDALPRLIHIIPKTSERTRYPAIISQSANESIRFLPLYESNALSAVQILPDGIPRQQQNESVQKNCGAAPPNIKPQSHQDTKKTNNYATRRLKFL
jgi:hypothetical protein